MRTTSNPAFRNLPAGGYAGFGSAPAGLTGHSGYVGAPATTERPMTVDDVVTKTGITLAVLVAAAAATWISDQWWLALPAALVGFVLAMVVIFKKQVSPPLILAYAAVEGVFLGGISAIFQQQFAESNIVLNAVVGTAAVFGGMLVVYKTGAVRVTPRFQKWMMGALIGVVGLMLVNLVASFFIDGGLGLRGEAGEFSWLAVGFSLLCIGVAAFSFLMDFDAADKAIRAGAPEKFAWYTAFGLTVTLVWLYLEMLRLLSYFQGE